MRRENLPKHCRPFEKDVGDVERVQNPGPLRGAETQ